MSPRNWFASRRRFLIKAALIPVAYTIGTDFKPAVRAPLETMVHWDRW